MDIRVLCSLILFSTLCDYCVAENEGTLINSDETCNEEGKMLHFCSLY